MFLILHIKSCFHAYADKKQQATFRQKIRNQTQYLQQNNFRGEKKQEKKQNKIVIRLKDKKYANQQIVFSFLFNRYYTKVKNNASSLFIII